MAEDIFRRQQISNLIWVLCGFLNWIFNDLSSTIRNQFLLMPKILCILSFFKLLRIHLNALKRTHDFLIMHNFKVFSMSILIILLWSWIIKFRRNRWWNFTFDDHGRGRVWLFNQWRHLDWENRWNICHFFFRECLQHQKSQISFSIASLGKVLQWDSLIRNFSRWDWFRTSRLRIRQNFGCYPDSLDFQVPNSWKN